MNATPTVIPAGPTPTEAEIRAYAHELYIHSGWLPGRDLDNWLQAEAHLTAIAQHAATVTLYPSHAQERQIDRAREAMHTAARPPRSKRSL